jgi:hypothetical protein
MNSTWYHIAVVVLWLATMSWLVAQKIVPSLLVGEPPSYRTVVEAQQQDPLVGWSMDWSGRQVGWALTATSGLPDDMTEVRSLVQFDRLPLREMTPKWIKLLLLPEDELPSELEMEVKSNLIFDPFQRLSQFETSIGLSSVENVITVRGTLDGAKLTVSVHSGDVTYEHKLDLPQEALLSDAFSPQTQLPGLRKGQKWNVEIYSPLPSGPHPLRNLQATVEGTEPIIWGGEMIDAWVVVYRDDPGSGTAGARAPRGKLWVRPDGTVLKQQVTLFDSTMTFVRLSDQEAAALAEEVGPWQ